MSEHDAEWVPKVQHLIYGHPIDDATVAEVEAIGIDAWLAQHPEAQQWLHDWHI